MKPFHCAFYVGVILVGSGCSHRSSEEWGPADIGCTNNLYKIAILLRQSIPVEPNYPSNLVALSLLASNGDVFICPATGHKVGEMQQLETWSDYIYVGNLPDLFQDPRIPLLICPPEHHRGEYGFIVTLDRKCERLPAPDIRKLIAAPWNLATSATSNEISYLKARVVVQVPKGLRTTYPDAYRSP
jgi:hypothetical protein